MLEQMENMIQRDRVCYDEDPGYLRAKDELHRIFKHRSDKIQGEPSYVTCEAGWDRRRPKQYSDTRIRRISPRVPNPPNTQRLDIRRISSRVPHPPNAQNLVESNSLSSSRHGSQLRPSSFDARYYRYDEFSRKCAVSTSSSFERPVRSLDRDRLDTGCSFLDEEHPKSGVYNSSSSSRHVRRVRSSNRDRVDTGYSSIDEVRHKYAELTRSAFETRDRSLDWDRVDTGCSSIDEVPHNSEPLGFFMEDRFVKNHDNDTKRELARSVQVIHYTASLKSWPRVYKSQQLIKGMVDRSSHLENMLGFQRQQDDKTDEISQIDIYMHSSVNKSPESFLVRGNTITEIERLKLELSETITDRKHELLSKRFVGIFVDTSGAKFIETISNTKIIVRPLPKSQSQTKELEPNQLTDFDTMKFQISSLLERIVFEKLSMKCKVLYDLRMSGNSKCYTAINDRENENYLQNVDDKTNEYKDAIDDLLGEMVALFKRSKLPKDVHPVLEGYEKKQVSEKVPEGLFSLDDKIRGCGYRYSTFNVNIVHSDDEKERMERIKTFLKKHDIYDVKFNFVTQSTYDYKYVGSKISIRTDIQPHERSATLGAYASFTKHGITDPCALISKHLATVSSDKKLLGYAKDEATPIEMGKILPESVDGEGYDIAAAIIHEAYMRQCDVLFKNEKNKPKQGIIYTSDLDIDLQDQYVHLWGAVSKPGLGIIRIPEVSYPDTTDTYMQVEDRSPLGGEELKHMAKPGDSGAIVCYEDLDDENIYVISMLMGGISDNNDCIEPSNNDGDRKAPGTSSNLGNDNAPSIIDTNVMEEAGENCDPANSENTLDKRETDENEDSFAKTDNEIHRNFPLQSDADSVDPESVCSNPDDSGTLPIKNGTGGRKNFSGKMQYMTFLVHKGIEQLQNVTEGVLELKGITKEKKCIP